jgi:hypothetical protein
MNVTLLEKTTVGAHPSGVRFAAASTREILFPSMHTLSLETRPQIRHLSTQLVVCVPQLTPLFLYGAYLVLEILGILWGVVVFVHHGVSKDLACMVQISPVE